MISHSDPVEVTPSPGSASDELLSKPLKLPAELHGWPLSILGLSVRLANSLKRLGVVVLGDLQDRTGAQLINTAGLGVTGIQQIHVSIEHLTAIPNVQDLVQRDGNGQSLVPRLSARVLTAVAAARTLGEEFEALLTELPERNASLVRERWASFDAGSTLDSIGHRHGLTRERVRQIVERHKKLVLTSNLRLPIAGRIVDLVEHAGGALTTPHLVRLLESEGLKTTRQELGILQTLSEMGVTGGRLIYSARHRLWLSDSGVARWINTHQLDEMNRSLKSRVRKRLARSGAVGRSDIRGLSPFGLSHALSVALRGKPRALRVGAYLLPVPSLNTPVTRNVMKMLAVTPLLNVTDVHAGLSQSARLDVPPIEVLLAELANHRDFVVSGEMVSAAKPPVREEVLSPSEQVIVSAMESSGGLLLWNEFTDAIQRAGFSFPMATVLLRQPFVVRRAIGIYGFRGRAVDPSLMRRKVRERQLARQNEVMRVRKLGADVLEVQFTLTPFSIQGVLATPSEIRRAGIVHWRGVFAGRERPLVAKNGFIYNLSRWLRDVGASVGDVVIATFYLGEARVEFNEPLLRRTGTDG